MSPSVSRASAPPPPHCCLPVTVSWPTTFTATATSHELTLQHDAVDDVGSMVHWDDVSLVQDAWVQTLAEASTVAEQVVRSQSGRIVANSLTSGTQGYAAQYGFDAASRMTQATLSVNGVVDHVLDYGFNAPGSACAGVTGAVANPGVNGNRTTFSDAHAVGGVTSTASTTYCYDAADRLLGSVVSGGIFDVTLDTVWRLAD